jgi:hypothetical protein
VHSTYPPQGYRYIDLEAYTENSNVRWAAILVKQPGQSQHVYSDLTDEEFSSIFASQYDAGYRMVESSVAVLNGTRHHAGLWVKANVGSYVQKDVTVANFGNEFTTQTNAGRKLISVNAYELGGTPYLSTVWYGVMNQGWTTYYNQTYSQLNSQQASNLGAGRYARGVTEYLSGGSSLYAGLWRAISNTAINSGPSGTTSSTSATFTFSSPDDPLATFECKLDAGAWAACTSAKTYSGLAVGSHTFSVRARDFEGLRDLTPASRTWSVS